MFAGVRNDDEHQSVENVQVLPIFIENDYKNNHQIGYSALSNQHTIAQNNGKE